MPYIIIIRDRYPIFDSSAPFGRLGSRTAVATVEEAREHIAPTILSASPNHVWHLAESGGTIGPLPDGTVIEVQPIDISDLADMADAFPNGEIPDDPRVRDEAIIDAYNNR